MPNTPNDSTKVRVYPFCSKPFKWHRKRKPNAKPERNRAIIISIIKGYKTKDIAKHHKISQGRVRTIWRTWKFE